MDFSIGRLAVERRIRAYHPWPGATTTYPTESGQKRLKLHGSEALESPVLPPGEVQEHADGLLIGTGDGAVLIKDLQTEGKRRMTAAEWLRGHHFPVATRLGG